MKRRRVTDTEPAMAAMALLWRETDLYPVVGWRYETAPTEPDNWVLEEGGPEDSEDRSYPWIGGEPGDGQPDWYMPLDDVMREFRRAETDSRV